MPIQGNMRHGRLDPWRASMDVQNALQARLAELPDPETDPDVRLLTAQVALAKAMSFIGLLRPDGRLLDVTDAPLTSSGLDRCDVIGSPLWRTPWVSAEVEPELRSAVERAAEGRCTRLDVELLTGSGGTAARTVDLVLRPLRNNDGRVTFILVEGRQVPDRSHTEERIARQNAELSVLTDRLARIHEFRERLLAELSHDLRAPLQIVLTRAERLRRNGSAAETEAQGIRLAALDALEQVDAMLQQVRRDHGEAHLAVVDDDLAAAVRSVAEPFEPLAAERGIRLVVEAPEQLPAQFDPERISRVVSNLLANALRFAGAGGVARCTLAAEGDGARLEVADSGAGVPPDQRARLFERFHSAGNHAGVGLGLAIVKEFVSLHGGDVTVGEAPEGGALFTARLPRDLEVSHGATATLSQRLAAARRARYVREHLEAELSGSAPAPLEELTLPAVMLADADPRRAAALAAALGPQATLCSADDEDEAFRLAAEMRPDMVVVGSLDDPGAAARLLDRMAREWRLAGVLRVAMVERGDAAGRDALLVAGAQDFIAEPAAPEEIRARFGLLLEHAGLRRRAEAAEAELRRLRRDAAGA
jgi:signal transduction histidine kinase